MEQKEPVTSTVNLIDNAKTMMTLPGPYQMQMPPAAPAPTTPMSMMTPMSYMPPWNNNMQCQNSIFNEIQDRINQLRQGFVHAPTSIQGYPAPITGVPIAWPGPSYQVPTSTYQNPMMPWLGPVDVSGYQNPIMPWMMVQTETGANVTGETLNDIKAADAEDFLV